MSKEKEEVLEKEEILEENEEISEENKEDEKAKELEDRYLRLLAEYDNYQKRTTKEKEARYADAVIDTVATFLPVLDDMERATSLEVTSDEAKKVKEGVDLVMKKLQDVFKNLGVEEIKALGEEFDPNIHNAVLHIEDETIAENTVVEELMKGYIYKGERVIRHSMVKVAN